jgi:hypothetical protein
VILATELALLGWQWFAIGVYKQAAIHFGIEMIKPMKRVVSDLF